MRKGSKGPQKLPSWSTKLLAQILPLSQEQILPLSQEQILQDYTQEAKRKRFINPFSLPISPPKSEFSYIH
jgi:hypothetical protein